MTTYREATTAALRATMARKGVKGSEIAQRLGVDRVSVSRWLNGAMPWARVDDIREILGMSCEDLAREVR